MTQRLGLLLILALFATSCAPPATLPAPTGTGTPLAERTATPKPVTATPTRTETPSPVPTPSRSAAISQVEPLVESRTSESVDFSAASTGQSFPVGGQTRTGEVGRARLDLAPDGTIIRLAPNSYFTLAKLEQREANPFTQLELFFGKIYIILSGGTLDVETPSGVASVRGSMMSVSYDADKKSMIVTCLEGHCSLRNDKGLVELVAGQAADIFDGVLSLAPRSLNDQELLDWLENVPELNDRPDLLASLKKRLEELRDIFNIPRVFPRPRP